MSVLFARFGIFLILVLSSIHLAYSQFDENKLYKAVKKGDWNGTTDQLERYFDDLGVSIHDSLLWIPKKPQTLYNYYDSRLKYPGIVAARYPSRKEIWDYWNYWSAKLTDSTWNAKKYFGSKSKAKKMAYYNVLMLLSHELGHHLADRQNVTPKNLNCHEYVADMASIALIMGYSDESKFKLLQESYNRLMLEINSNIPSKNRFSFLKADLHKYCDAIPVVFPEDSTLMPQYASAYFERRKFLHKDFGYKNPRELVKEVFLTNHMSFLRKYKRLNTDCLLRNDVVEPFRHPSTIAFQRGIDQMLFRENRVYEVNGYYLDAKRAPMNYKMIIPSNLVKGSLVNLELSDWEGKLHYRWHYYPKETRSIIDIEGYGIVCDQADGKINMLTIEEDKNKTELFLYRNQAGLRLKKEALNIVADEGRFNLLQADGNDLRILKSAFEPDSVLRFYLIDYDIRKKKAKGELVFEYEGASSNFVHWVADQGPDESLYLALEQYLLKIKGTTVKTIGGTGIQGNKHKGNSTTLSEFGYARDLHFSAKGVRMIDERIESNSERNTLFLRDFIIK